MFDGLRTTTNDDEDDSSQQQQKQQKHEEEKEEEEELGVRYRMIELFSNFDKQSLPFS